MRGFNRIFIAGYLGGDPEILLSREGSTYARLYVATSRSWFAAEPTEPAEPAGAKAAASDLHRVVVWGRQALMCAKHLRKGNALAVEGHLSLHKVNEMPCTSIVADRVHFLPSSKQIEFTFIEGEAPPPGREASRLTSQKAAETI